MLNYRTHFYS